MSKSICKAKVRYTGGDPHKANRPRTIDITASWLCGSDVCFFKIQDNSILVDAKEVLEKLREIGITEEDNTKLYFRFNKNGDFCVKPNGKEKVFLEEIETKDPNVKDFYRTAKGVSSSKGAGGGADDLREKLKKHKYVREEEKGVFWIETSSGSGGDPLQQVFDDIDSAFKKKRGGAGEGPAHKALKEFVKNHPGVLDLPDKISATTEAQLPSGDKVDVKFDDEKQLVLAEVKAATSDKLDVERGLYQCVKYKAVVEELLKYKRISRSVRAVLVLESALPEELQPLKKSLGIEVCENIKPGG